MRITKPKRGRRGAKRLDLSDLRELLRDRRSWTAIGVVYKPLDGEHYEQVDGPADVVVEVMLQPSLTPVTCRLSAGIWAVPDVGEEVAVLIPQGDPSFMPLIVALLSSDSVPSDQGPAPGRIAIVRGEVVVDDGAGGAAPLALKSDVQALKDWVQAQFSGTGHTHAVSGAATTGVTPASGPPTTPSDPVGTSVLKGK